VRPGYQVVNDTVVVACEEDSYSTSWRDAVNATGCTPCPPGTGTLNATGATHCSRLLTPPVTVVQVGGRRRLIVSWLPAWLTGAP
jgi:hypothetical protein